MDLYVYYRVQHQHSAELQAIVMNMQEKLGNLHGMNFSLKRRVEKMWITKHGWKFIFPFRTNLQMNWVSP